MSESRILLVGYSGECTRVVNTGMPRNMKSEGKDSIVLENDQTKRYVLGGRSKRIRMGG